MVISDTSGTSEGNNTQKLCMYYIFYVYIILLLFKYLGIVTTFNLYSSLCAFTAFNLVHICLTTTMHTQLVHKAYTIKTHIDYTY